MTKFEIFKDVGGYFRWRLVAGNGEIVATSEAYSFKSSATESAKSVEGWAHDARFVDLT